MDMEATDAYISEHIGRKLTVVGACIESDAHTVGIDAIMNMKGYNHRFGLERYQMFNAINMGRAGAVGRPVGQGAQREGGRDPGFPGGHSKEHPHQKPHRLIELAEAERLRDKMLFICGGPRISHELAIELGYDAGFGTGSYSTDVASFIAITLAARAVKA